jgi:hypothetical protein
MPTLTVGVKWGAIRALSVMLLVRERGGTSKELHNNPGVSVGKTGDSINAHQNSMFYA